MSKAQFLMTSIQDSWEVLGIVLQTQLMWETFRLHAWLLDARSEERSHISRPLWGCTGRQGRQAGWRHRARDCGFPLKGTACVPHKMGMQALEGFHP